MAILRIQVQIKLFHFHQSLDAHITCIRTFKIDEFSDFLIFHARDWKVSFFQMLLKLLVAALFPGGTSSATPRRQHF